MLQAFPPCIQMAYAKNEVSDSQEKDVVVHLRLLSMTVAIGLTTTLLTFWDGSIDMITH